MVAYNHFYTDNIYASIYLKEKTNKNLIICSVFFIQSNEKTPFTGFYAIHPIIHQLVEPPLALTT